MDRHRERERTLLGDTPVHYEIPLRAQGWILGVLTTALVAVILVFYVFFTPLQVVGDSMLPGLEDGDRLLLSRGYDTPRVGDVVMLSNPESRDGLIKRIVAVEGDTVEVTRDVAIVNGRAESSEDIVVVPEYGMTRPPLTVPEGHVYVLGDNRPVSLDSRVFGPLPDDKATHKALWIFWPPGRISRVR